MRVYLTRGGSGSVEGDFIRGPLQVSVDFTFQIIKGLYSLFLGSFLRYDQKDQPFPIQGVNKERCKNRKWNLNFNDLIRFQNLLILLCYLKAFIFKKLWLIS